MKFPVHEIPLVEIKVKENITLFIKREDLVHRAISGNKYWKLFYNINNYLAKQPEKPQLITFGGAYSNHIAATAALGKDLGIATLGIIRGEELANSWQQNPTLLQAAENGMKFRFITRQQYRNKSVCSTMLEAQFPGALLIPEGGSNVAAVQGVQHMLNKQTESFDYLCTAPFGYGVLRAPRLRSRGAHHGRPAELGATRPRSGGILAAMSAPGRRRGI